MKKIVRPWIAVAAAVTTATALTFAPSEPAPTREASATSTARLMTLPLDLTAAAQPILSASVLPDLLGGWFDRILVPPSAGAPFPEPDFPPIVGGNSVSSFVKNTYNAIEPWVQYGFELATYAVGWVPYVGWLAPQIMYFYNLGERIVRSITFNVADVLGGNISFAQGLINVGIDTINSFIFFANDEIAFWLPPLPPIPPIGPFSATAEAEPETADLTAARASEDSTSPLDEKATVNNVVTVTDDVDAAAKEVSTDDEAVTDEVTEESEGAESETTESDGTEESTEESADTTEGTESAESEESAETDEVTTDTPPSEADAGADGANGADGADGANGADGTDDADGADGADGAE
jgi:hypothetical protein